MTGSCMMAKRRTDGAFASNDLPLGASAMTQEIVNLAAGKHGGQRIVIADADLGENRPVVVPQELDVEHAGGGNRLADGFGPPMLLEFDEEEIVAQLSFGEAGRIAAQMLMHQAQLTVVGVAGAIGIIVQGQELGKARHGIVGMAVIHGIGVSPGRSGHHRRAGGFALPLVARRVGDIALPRGGGTLEVAVAGEGRIAVFHRPAWYPPPMRTKRGAMFEGAQTPSPRSGLVQPGAAPNGGLKVPQGNSGVTQGPSSVS